MDAARIGLKPFLAALAAVGALEAAAALIPGGPLAATGAVRLLDIAVVCTLVFVYHGGLSPVGLSRATVPAGLRTGMLWSALFGAAACAAGMILLVSGMEPLPLIQVRLPDSARGRILMFAVGGVAGPVAEELVYRGLVYSFARRWGIWAALCISTLLFVLSHPWGGAPPVPQIVGGIVFCLAYERSKSLVAPMIIHMLGNTALFSISLAYAWLS
jgi:hypothetical protein